MKIVTFNVKIVATHLAVWLVYIFYESSLLILLNVGALNYWETLLNFVIYALLFYANAELLLPWLARKRNYLLFVVALLAIFAAYVALRGGLNMYLLPELGQHMLRPVSSAKLFWAQTVSRGIYFLMLSFGYWFARNAVMHEKQRRKQEAQLRIAERNLLEAEVAFLKSQINPHFLFNALNFLYAQVYPLSESAAKSILLLSSIMRYALKEPEESGKVMLEEEVYHLQNYIEINQLRFGNRLQVQFKIEGSLYYLMILPLVLITFVENCFKHGELFDADHPLIIQLQMTDNRLLFYTHNKKRHGPKEKTTGIGLANTRKRLEVMYVGRHSLVVNDSADFYTCTLSLDL
ncbi:histidine kinase [Hymenobacter sp. NST-14]|uniref:sensor histidine kinase n=1 Tax=Hymenobacter piscis TaxID=2839984 RepID=UPI001C00F95D|nr:histidine kinase [Hymenobacter piscis]MBT9393146.1 histidine kinase [Hymenobacter piscis]